MSLVIVCEITEQENPHKCHEFSNPMDSKMVDLDLRREVKIGDCFTIDKKNKVKSHDPKLKMEVLEGVVHITTKVVCYPKDLLKDELKKCGGRPLSFEIGSVRDPQGKLKESFKDGKKHEVRVRYAPMPGEPEAFEIADVVELTEDDTLQEETRDEEHKENNKKIMERLQRERLEKGKLESSLISFFLFPELPDSKMTLVIVCEIHGQDDQLVHKCYDFTNPVDTKMVDKSLGRTRRHIGRCYRIGRQGGISWIRPNFTVSLKEGVVHITTTVSCYRTGALGPLEERFGGRPFSRRIGFVRDPQGFLRESYKIGKQHKVVVRYAPLPGVPEVFEIVEAYEFAYSDVKLSPSKKKSDEDDKENGKRKYKAPKSKSSGIKGSRQALVCR